MEGAVRWAGFLKRRNLSPAGGLGVILFGTMFEMAYLWSFQKIFFSTSSWVSTRLFLYSQQEKNLLEMNILSYAGPAAFSTSPRRYVLWVLPNGHCRVSYYYKAVRAALQFTSIAGLGIYTHSPDPFFRYVVAKREISVGSWFTFPVQIRRAAWIYYSRNISTTTTTR